MTADQWVLVIGGTLSALVMLILGIGLFLVTRDSIRRRGRWGVNGRPVFCPECGEAAPILRKPKNRRQALWGGTTCAKCGTEYDKWGERVTEDG